MSLLQKLKVWFFEREEEEEKETCAGCGFLGYYSDGSTFCEKNVTDVLLRRFNDQNIRPCKEQK